MDNVEEIKKIIAAKVREGCKSFIGQPMTPELMDEMSNKMKTALQDIVPLSWGSWDSEDE